MSTHKISCQGRVQQDHGFKYTNHLSPFFGAQLEPLDMGSHQQNFGLVSSSSSPILSRIGLSAATEGYASFPQYEYQSQFGSNQNYGYSERSSIVPCNDFSESQRILQLKRKLLGDFDASNERHLSNPLEKNRDLSVFQNLYNSQLEHMRQSCGPSGIVLSSKTRIRWTQDLHERFIDCVNRLGGAEKATPKAILKLMDTEGLTILHVKSHLQKYRTAKYMPESAEGKSEKKTDMNDATGKQIREALQVQLDFQRRLRDQLETQRNLQLRIEEQGKQLKMMFDQQQKASGTLIEMKNSSVMPTFDDDPSTNLDGYLQIPIDGGSGNAYFPSKIS
ncbi:hypothetical protein U1Q18_012781 [Sarracenia purpurea var. burkii]